MVRVLRSDAARYTAPPAAMICSSKDPLSANAMVEGSMTDRTAVTAAIACAA